MEDGRHGGIRGESVEPSRMEALERLNRARELFCALDRVCQYGHGVAPEPEAERERKRAYSAWLEAVEAFRKAGV